MTDQRLASSVGRTHPHSVTFEVSEFFLQESERWLEWSEPVQFRFEPLDDGTYSLVVRTVPCDPSKLERRG